MDGVDGEREEATQCAREVAMGVTYRMTREEVVACLQKKALRSDDLAERLRTRATDRAGLLEEARRYLLGRTAQVPGRLVPMGAKKGELPADVTDPEGLERIANEIGQKFQHEAEWRERETEALQFLASHVERTGEFVLPERDVRILISVER